MSNEGEIWSDADWEAFQEEIDTDWEGIRAELAAAAGAPKIAQLENINILNILKMVPKDETWLICLGRFRVKWSDADNWESWWSPKVVWWMGRIDVPDPEAGIGGREP